MNVTSGSLNGTRRCGRPAPSPPRGGARSALAPSSSTQVFVACRPECVCHVGSRDGRAVVEARSMRHVMTRRSSLVPQARRQDRGRAPTPRRSDSTAVHEPADRTVPPMAVREHRSSGMSERRSRAVPRRARRRRVPPTTSSSATATVGATPWVRQRWVAARDSRRGPACLDQPDDSHEKKHPRAAGSLPRDTLIRSSTFPSRRASPRSPNSTTGLSRI